MVSTIYRSVCPYDCPDTCGLIVEVQNGKAIRVTGDLDHPFTRGKLCPKMLHYERTVHSSRRLIKPLLRTGPKGSGQFREISWDHAVETIAERWRGITARYGAEAILPYSYGGTIGMIQRNAGHPFFHRLGASRLERTICSPAKDAGLKAVLGDTPAPSPFMVQSSDLVILWGINAAATSIHFLNLVTNARRNGAKVWYIDTYETPTATAADELFLVRPGSDAALALGIMHIIVREGLEASAFMSDHVQGFSDLRDQILPDYPPWRVADLTGLSTDCLEKMALAYAGASAPFIALGGGLSRYGNGAMTVRTIACLPALVGAYGKNGGGLSGGTSTGKAFALNEVLLREDFMETPTRIINMNQLGRALNSLSEYSIRSLYVYHSNPAVVAPDQNAVLRGLARDDLFTVVHERFMTDTARYADIVLPATTSLEHSDLYRSYGAYHIQRAAAVIPSVGESRSNWDTFALLAEALGFVEPFFRQSADDLIDRLLADPNPFREGVDLTALSEGSPVDLPAFTSRGFHVCTPSGKIEILNTAENQPLPYFLPPYESEGRFPLKLMTAVTLYALNSSFYEREDLREKQKEMRIRLNPDDAAARGIKDGMPVIAVNDLGEVYFIAEVTSNVPRGIVVAEGVWWLEFAPGERSVNALTSQRLTDQGYGSTFYDTAVDVRLIS